MTPGLLSPPAASSANRSRNCRRAALPARQDIADALDDLPLAPAERSLVRQLARPPHPLLLAGAVFMGVLGTLCVTYGWSGIAFATRQPLPDEHVSTVFAYQSTRQLSFFYVGVMQLCSGLFAALAYAFAHRRHAAMEKLVRHAAGYPVDATVTTKRTPRVRRRLLSRLISRKKRSHVV